MTQCFIHEKFDRGAFLESFWPCCLPWFGARTLTQFELQVIKRAWNRAIRKYACVCWTRKHIDESRSHFGTKITSCQLSDCDQASSFKETLLRRKKWSQRPLINLYIYIYAHPPPPWTTFCVFYSWESTDLNDDMFHEDAVLFWKETFY